MGIDTRQSGANAGNRRHGTVSERLTEEPQELEATAATVEALARALELHDYRRGRFGETSAHTARVTQLALRLAEVVAPELALDPQLAYGFRLHDIGMIGVSNVTLLKPGALSPAEVDEIREHPVARRAHRRPGARARRRRAAGDRVPSRALGRLRAIRAGCAERRSRSPRASLRSSTRTTR